jgi:hypothetical protein
MQLIETVEKPFKQRKGSQMYPHTVGEMLDYIKKNKIPRSAEVVVEHLNDSYLRAQGWSYYNCKTKDNDWPNIMLPVHNGFGSIEDKKYFALWMHY